MSTRCTVLFLLLLLPRAAFPQEKESRDDLLGFRSDLVQVIHQLDLSKFSAGDSITLSLAASDAFNEAKMVELSGHYFQQAISVASASDGQKYSHRLFDHALKIHDLKSAVGIAAASGRKKRFLDRLAVEMYRRGDDDALEGFPRERLDFHLALDLADAYAKRREYEKLETFVRGIDSLPSNQPTDVGAIIWRRIADEFRSQGNVAKAKEFIDKAAEIGGNNYYTGYGVRVARLSIHGGLKEEAKKYANLAVAYRGHHTRELLSRLLRELVAAGHYGVAEDTLKYYPSPEDRMSAERYLAHGLAQQGQFSQATKMAKSINDQTTSAIARVLVSRQLFEAGKLEPAITMTLEAADLLAKSTESSAEYHTRSLARLLARMNQRETVMEVIDSAETPLGKGQRASAAIEGISLRIDPRKDKD